MSALRERDALYRELILTAAEGEFARAGFADAKMTAIAQAADLSLATVYKTFTGKEEIWNELHERRVGALFALLDLERPEAGSPLERLLSGIEIVARYLTDHDTYLELNLRTAPGWLSDAGTAGVQRTFWATGTKMMDAAVDAARSAGEISGIRTRIASGLIVSALQIWMADWLHSGRERDADDVVTEFVSHVRLLLTGTGSALPEVTA